MNYDETATQTPNRYFGRYRFERELGRGGMGVVVLAEDEELQRPVALKLLPESFAGNAEAIAKLKTEVLRGMKLTHPGIVRVHHFERDPQLAAIVMEYVPGETLADCRARQPGGCFEWFELEPWIEQLCGALDYAHRETRIAHRDLKPRNLMLTPEGRIKIADFGLAAQIDESLTQIGGTPPYMSPQQVRGEHPTCADDLYALGATLYDLLTGKPPFFRGDIFSQALYEIPVSMAQRREELGVTDKAAIPRSWELAIAACLAKEPQARPASGADFLERLRNAAVEDLPVVRVVRPAAKPKSKPIENPAARTISASHATHSGPEPHTNQQRSTHVTSAIPPFSFRARRSSQAERSGFLRRCVATVLAAALTAGALHFWRHATPSAPDSSATKTPATSSRPSTNRLGNPTLETTRGL
jgi:serine/threonine protein kinase